MRTATLQSTTPKQSPVLHAAPPPLFPPVLLGPVPAELKLQFVRPHTRPCQSWPTVRLRVVPGPRRKPLVPGLVPACVANPGYIVSLHWLVTTRGTVLARVLTWATGGILIWCNALVIWHIERRRSMPKGIGHLPRPARFGVSKIERAMVNSDQSGKQGETKVIDRKRASCYDGQCSCR